MNAAGAPAAVADSDELDFARYLAAIWRRRVLIVAVVAVAGAGAWLLAARAAPRYRAVATLTAVTPWAVPVDVNVLPIINGAILNPDTWAQALSSEGRPPASTSTTISVDPPGTANTIAISVVDSDPAVAVRLANTMLRAAPDRLRSLRRESQDGVAAEGEAEVARARAAFDQSTDALSKYLERNGVRLLYGEPVDSAGRPVRADVRSEVDRLRTEQAVANSAYVQATLWQLDMRRQTGTRLPELVPLTPASSAAQLGPRPTRAAAIAATLALLAALALALAAEAARTVFPRGLRGAASEEK